MRAFVAILLGAVCGDAVSVVVGPRLLTWYATPAIPNACDCRLNIEWAMSHLLWTQLILSVIGASLFVALYLIVFRKAKPAPVAAAGSGPVAR